MGSLCLLDVEGDSCLYICQVMVEFICLLVAKNSMHVEIRHTIKY